MGTALKFHYDRDGDILYIDKVTPYAEQDSDEIGDNVIARFNPTSGEIENLEVLFFNQRVSRGEPLELPIAADLRLAAHPR
jgi:uncharacterized protein YuzE